MDARIKLILLLAIFLISPASAKFICGEVVSTDKVSPAWYEAKVYLAANENYFSTCLVSPLNNKYCCDLDAIKDRTGYQWKALDIFETKITDPTSGYFATPKSLTLTGEGYDVAPKLTLEKAITITNPNSTLTVSTTLVPIQISIPDSCSNTTLSQDNITMGESTVEITTICNGKQFETSKTFFLVENITFQKQYSAEFGKSKKNPRLRSDTSGTITIKTKLSTKIENIPLKEYIPSSWQVTNISGNGTIQESTPEYNVIIWSVSGKNFDFSYDAKAPAVGMRPEQFTFKTQIDEYDLDESEIKVSKAIPLPIVQKMNKGGYVYTPQKMSKVSPELPLIFKEENMVAALYSNNIMQQGSFNLLNFISNEKFDKNFDYLKSYKVQTTLNSTEKGKIVLEYEVSKEFLEENNYKEISLLEKSKGKLSKITGAIVGVSGDSLKYRFESENSPSEIYILAEKNKTSLKDKILKLLSKIRFW